MSAGKSPMNLFQFIAILLLSYLKVGDSIESPLLEIDFSSYTNDIGAPFDLYGGAQITTVDGYLFSALRVTSDETYAIIPNLDIR